jgi:CheY-like chemotaxis protein
MPGTGNHLRGKRLLVVEDEFLILLDIQHILETAGATVTAAGRLSEALEALAGQTFDAVLLDLKLNTETSLELAAQLVARKIPFLFMTGAPSEAKQAQQFAHVAVVGKPFDSVALLAALSQTLPEQS